MWNPRDSAEVAAAKKQFEDLVRGRFKAFRVKKDGKPGKEVKTFDPEEGKLILVPPMAGG